MRRNKINDQDVLNNANKSFDCLDDQRAAELKRSKTLHEVKDRALARERNRLIQKYGPDHVRVKKIEKRQAYNKGLFNDLDTQIVYTQNPAPSLNKGEWRLKGRVLTSLRKPVKGVTVSLFDKDGKWVRELGYSCTDEQGFYRITVSLDKLDWPDEEVLSVFPTVSTDNKTIIHQEEKPVLVERNKIIHRDIILGEQCETPPNSIDDNPGPDDDQDTFWAVKGKVLFDNTIAGIPNLTVQFEDSTGILSNLPGIIQTDKDGKFEVRFLKKDIPELFEELPKVFIRILDSEGRTYYRSSRGKKVEANKTWTVNIKIKQVSFWGVRGKVTSKSGELPINDLIVQLYDKENVFTEKLGKTETNSTGMFRLLYSVYDYPDLFKAKPELFLKVMDPNGDELYASRKGIQFEAGKDEVKNIKIK